MFLFLSKLLPLFIYPLGLSCFLMLIAFVLLWWYPKWSALVIFLAFIVTLTFSNSWVSQGLIKSLEWQNLPPKELPSAEAIVVLGGGIKPANSPRPWVDFSEAGDRILHGVRLYKQGKAPFMILSGGRIDWKDGGNPESGDMAEIAESMGVPKTAILQDTDSLNTYQNAVNVKQILETKEIKGSVLLVTSALHTPRSILIFKKQKIPVIPAPTDFLVTERDLQEKIDSWQGILLNIIPDAANLQNSTKALKEYIGMIVYRLRGWL
ncbi:MAG: YdcF family protein [Okeania sp. SIO2F4]|uniref:YdcF family protein n=1 Tax=Okeania sp. SIO2F4 TaxID=2607790 RepID=UPI00142B235B|nr:YdcF family protein [Okeania sp. SIO2F4]NES03835.1 YdcF family protein [Okeania sp. SIO2F4]